MEARLDAANEEANVIEDRIVDGDAAVDLATIEDLDADLSELDDTNCALELAKIPLLKVLNDEAPTEGTETKVRPKQRWKLCLGMIRLYY